MQWSFWLSGEHQAHDFTCLVKFDHAPPFELEYNTRAFFVALELCLLIEALSFGKIPFDSAFKLTLDVGEHGGWVSMDHVITMKALSMGDPCPSQGYAL